jgi:hypothetical protein
VSSFGGAPWLAATIAQAGEPHQPGRNAPSTPEFRSLSLCERCKLLGAHGKRDFEAVARLERQDARRSVGAQLEIMFAQRIYDAKARVSAPNDRVDHFRQGHHEAADDFNRNGELQVPPYEVCDKQIDRRAVLVGFEALQMLYVDGRFKSHVPFIGSGETISHPISVEDQEGIGSVRHWQPQRRGAYRKRGSAA